MRLVIVSVGKLKDAGAQLMAGDYRSRLNRYLRCDEVEVRQAGQLKAALPKDALVVAMEVKGEALTSQQLARRVEAWGSRGKGVMAFVIGGAEGIPAELSSQADARLSLSTLTLPHRLARVLLLEQLYRAMTILRGEPYARES